MLSCVQLIDKKVAQPLLREDFCYADTAQPSSRCYPANKGVSKGLSNENDSFSPVDVRIGSRISATTFYNFGYAPVNGLKMYYEVHGSGDPVVLLHGAYMTIPDNWTGWIGELSKTRKVIAIEMQGHGRTADIKREISYENLADDVAALLDHLEIRRRT